MAGLVAVLVLDVAWLAFCYYQLIRYPAKVLPKPVWAILILLSSVLGGLAYLAAERWRDKDSNPPLLACLKMYVSVCEISPYIGPIVQAEPHCYPNSK